MKGLQMFTTIRWVAWTIRLLTGVKEALHNVSDSSDMFFDGCSHNMRACYGMVKNGKRCSSECLWLKVQQVIIKKKKKTV